MRIVEINTVNFGSTGNIMLGIAEIASSKGHEVIVCVPKSREKKKKNVSNQIFIGNRISRNVHRLLGRITGLQGVFSYYSTKYFLKQLEKFRPDIIHLHNLHGAYINLNLLFRYIQEHNVSTVWTLHDCWAMTGQCPHFTMAKCGRWKTGCHNCPQLNVYPESISDRSKWMWKHKREWFTGLHSLTIITPSEWLAQIVHESYLKEYPVRVIYNGIDLDVFKPTHGDFHERYKISDKFIVLGVAASWGKRKGLDVFVELSSRLDEKYKIVLVGVTEDAELPKNIITIHHTQNQAELAEIYTAADVFVNPTREEVLGLVNIEANACGTPVITFKTGGSPECIDETSGMVVECDNIDEMEQAIINVCENLPYTEESCRKRAMNFDRNERFGDYVELYERILTK